MDDRRAVAEARLRNDRPSCKPVPFIATGKPMTGRLAEKASLVEAHAGYPFFPAHADLARRQRSTKVGKYPWRQS